jgi:hypothetical protein
MRVKKPDGTIVDIPLGSGVHVGTDEPTDGSTVWIDTDEQEEESGEEEIVGIQSIEQTETSDVDGGENIITATLTDGSESVFKVRNGSKGSKGDKGDPGIQGEKGEKGEKGAPYTLTASDKQEIVSEVIGSLPETPSSGTTIDVVAEVGQTIVVKEVDAGGKPTKWEAAGYQPRTHWEEKDTTFVFPADGSYYPFKINITSNPSIIPSVVPIRIGEVYNVYFDNVLYICRTVIGNFMGAPCIVLGNEALIGGINTGEPFALGVIEGMDVSAVTATEVGSHTIRVTKSTIHSLDSRYYNNDFCINLSRNENNSWTIDKTADEIMSAYNRGMRLLMKYREVGGTSTQPVWFDYKFTNFSVRTEFTQEGRPVIFDFSCWKEYSGEQLRCHISIAVAASGTSLVSVGVEGIE